MRVRNKNGGAGSNSLVSIQMCWCGSGWGKGKQERRVGLIRFRVCSDSDSFVFHCKRVRVREKAREWFGKYQRVALIAYWRRWWRVIAIDSTPTSLNSLHAGSRPLDIRSVTSSLKGCFQPLITSSNSYFIRSLYLHFDFNFSMEICAQKTPQYHWFQWVYAIPRIIPKIKLS